MFDTPMVAKILASLAVIYAAYYFGYLSAEKDQPRNHKNKANTRDIVDDIQTVHKIV